MAKFLIIFKHSLTLFLVLSCFVHLVYIAYYFVYPELPEITVQRIELEEMEEFPISFRLCMFEPQNNAQRYKNIGYENYGYFYWGMNMRNNSLFGWKGFFENGSTFASATGFEDFKCHNRITNKGSHLPWTVSLDKFLGWVP